MHVRKSGKVHTLRDTSSNNTQFAFSIFFSILFRIFFQDEGKLNLLQFLADNKKSNTADFCSLAEKNNISGKKWKNKHLKKSIL